MRALVCGVPTWDGREIVEREMATLNSGDVLVEGCDCLVIENVGRQKKMLIEHHPTQWGPYGHQAPTRRITEMLDSGVDYVVALWDGLYRPVQQLIKEATARGLPVRVVMPTGTFIEYKGDEIVNSTTLTMARAGTLVAL